MGRRFRIPWLTVTALALIMVSCGGDDTGPGSGTRGTFDATFPFRGGVGRATLRVFEVSAEDGRPVNEVRIPVEIE